MKTRKQLQLAINSLQRLTDKELNYLLMDGIRRIRRTPQQTRLAVGRIFRRIRVKQNFHMYAVVGADLKHVCTILDANGIELTTVSRNGGDEWFIRRRRCTRNSHGATSGTRSRNSST